jgi:hypothetical protein
VTRRRVSAERIVDALRSEIAQSSLTIRGHLSLAEKKLYSLAGSGGIEPLQITGRTKSRARAIAKLLDTPDDSLSGIMGSLAGMDMIGLRVVVAGDGQLQRLLSALLPKAIHLKDYVADPRRDGQFLGGDASDVYRGYHLFTRQLTGVPLEIQMFTAEMRRAGIRLKRKYGSQYWKSLSFRRRRMRAGDLR